VPGFVALALGALPYFARPQTTLVGGAVGLPSAGSALLRRVPPAIAGSLPDAAWAFALAYTVAVLWAEGPPLARRTWLSVGLALAAGWEIAQAARLVPGTFDLLDLIASVIAYGMGLVAARISHFYFLRVSAGERKERFR
jgi:hypothetical protein